MAPSARGSARLVAGRGKIRAAAESAFSLRRASRASASRRAPLRSSRLFRSSPPRGAPHSTARPAPRLCIALVLTMSALRVAPCRVSPAAPPRRAPAPARAGAPSVVVAGARGAVRANPRGSLRARPTRRVSRRAAGARAAIETDSPFPYPVIDRTPKTLTLHIGESVVTIETGRVGLQANGAVMVTEGETVMYTTICAGREVTADGGFVPLTVNYQERFSAVGKTPGGYRKRDGGVRENETLIGRLVDRPLRPMIPKGWAYDTQILEWVLSYDGVRSTDALAITAASAAAAISDVPLKKPIAGVRVGLLPGEKEPILNPTSEQMSRSRLDLVLAGTEDAVMMIEGFGDFLTVDEMLYAIEKGHEAVANACREIEAWAKEVGRDKATEKMLKTPEGVDEAVEAAVGAELAEAMAIGQKQVRGAAVERVRNKAMEALEENYSVRAGRSERDASPVAPPSKFRSFFFPVAVFFPSLPDASRSTDGTARTHRRAPVASHSWGRRRRAQLPRAQIARHEYFERTLGPPRRRNRELPKSSLCTYPTFRRFADPTRRASAPSRRPSFVRAPPVSLRIGSDLFFLLRWFPRLSRRASFRRLTRRPLFVPRRRRMFVWRAGAWSLARSAT